MENGNINRLSGGRIVLLFLLALFITFIVFYTVMSLLGPARKMAEIEKEFTPAQVTAKDFDRKILSDSTYISLLKERAFLQARVIMAETDSIYLTLNLADSSINLEISGVTVHRARMTRIKTSRILHNGSGIALTSMLSAPLTIASDYSTIRKEPVMIKMAPKDTSEYKPDIMPDTSITEPVNYILEMTNGIRIFFYQDEDSDARDRRSRFALDMNDRLRYTWNNIKSIASFKVPEYQPVIKIQLPMSDAKIIYRAIPRYGQIGIYL